MEVKTIDDLYVGMYFVNREKPKERFVITKVNPDGIKYQYKRNDDSKHTGELSLEWFQTQSLYRHAPSAFSTEKPIDELYSW